MIMFIERRSGDATEQPWMRDMRVRQRGGQHVEGRLAGGAGRHARGVAVALRRVQRRQPQLQRHGQRRQPRRVQQPRVLPAELLY